MLLGWGWIGLEKICYEMIEVPKLYERLIRALIFFDQTSKMVPLVSKNIKFSL